MSAEFFIDDRPYELPRGQVTMSMLLRLAGMSSRDYVLVSEEGRELDNPDEPVQIARGARYNSRKRGRTAQPIERPLRYTVNGEPNSSVDNQLTVRFILQNAGAGAAIDVADLESYYLENIANGRKFENLDDIVTVSEGDCFMAIHIGANPVA